MLLITSDPSLPVLLWVNLIQGPVKGGHAAVFPGSLLAVGEAHTVFTACLFQEVGFISSQQRLLLSESIGAREASRSKGNLGGGCRDFAFIQE